MWLIAKSRLNQQYSAKLTNLLFHTKYLRRLLLMNMFFSQAPILTSLYICVHSLQDEEVSNNLGENVTITWRINKRNAVINPMEPGVSLYMGAQWYLNIVTDSSFLDICSCEPKQFQNQEISIDSFWHNRYNLQRLKKHLKLGESNRRNFITIEGF